MLNSNEVWNVKYLVVICFKQLVHSRIIDCVIKLFIYYIYERIIFIFYAIYYLFFELNFYFLNQELGNSLLYAEIGRYNAGDAHRNETGNDITVPAVQGIILWS